MLWSLEIGSTLWCISRFNSARYITIQYVYSTEETFLQDSMEVVKR